MIALIGDVFEFLQSDLLKDAAAHQDDSDLEKKRRETEAMLQSMGIASDAPVGMLRYMLVRSFSHILLIITFNLGNNRYFGEPVLCFSWLYFVTVLPLWQKLKVVHTPTGWRV